MRTSISAATAAFLVCNCFLEPVLAYVALGRVNHQAVLIGSTIMIYGGSTTPNPTTSDSDLILLSVNQTFSTASPPYLPNSGPQADATPVQGCSLNPGGQNHDELFIYGGNIPASFQLSIYTQSNNQFQNGSWPANSGPTPRDSHTAVTNLTSSLAYIFGGETSASVPLNDLWVLDTIQLQWRSIPSTIPLPRQAHSAAMTADGRMVITGGTSTTNGSPVSLASVDVFDSNLLIWTKYTAASPPTARLSHTTVCTHDNKVILFGGDDTKGGFLGDLAILDMSAATLSWAVPTTTGTPPAGRYGHAAVMVGTVMLIFYGQTGKTTLDANIYAFDTAANAWTTTFTPNNLQYTWPFITTQITSGAPASGDSTTPTSATNTSPSTSPTQDGGGGGGGGSGPPVPIIGGVAGGVALIAVGVAFFFFYRRTKRPRQEGTPNYNIQNPSYPPSGVQFNNVRLNPVSSQPMLGGASAIGVNEMRAGNRYENEPLIRNSQGLPYPYDPSTTGSEFSSSRPSSPTTPSVNTFHTGNLPQQRPTSSYSQNLNSPTSYYSRPQSRAYPQDRQTVYEQFSPQQPPPGYPYYPQPQRHSQGFPPQHGYPTQPLPQSPTQPIYQKPASSFDEYSPTGPSAPNSGSTNKPNEV